MTGKRDEARVREARRLHGLGLTTAAIGAQLGVDPTTVQRWTKDVARRRGPRERPRVNLTDSDIVALRENGISFYEIGLRLGLPRSTARNRYYAATGEGRPERRKQAGEHATQTATGETP